VDFSPVQIAIVIVIALLVFGSKRLPELGKSLGSGMREFTDSITADGKPAQPAAELESDASPSSLDEHDRLADSGA
jgi:sec-independent protein translocase protein TatA